MKEQKLCEVCGTPLVKSNKTLLLDGSRKLDGSWDLNGMVCPKCHPGLAKAE